MLTSTAHYIFTSVDTPGGEMLTRMHLKRNTADMEDNTEKSPPSTYDQRLTPVKLIKEKPVILDKSGDFKITTTKKLAWKAVKMKRLFGKHTELFYW